MHYGPEPEGAASIFRRRQDGQAASPQIDERKNLFRERQKQRRAAAGRSDFQNVAAAEIEHIDDTAEVLAAPATTGRPIKSA